MVEQVCGSLNVQTLIVTFRSTGVAVIVLNTILEPLSDAKMYQHNALNVVVRKAVSTRQVKSFFALYAQETWKNQGDWQKCLMPQQQLDQKEIKNGYAESKND